VAQAIAMNLDVIAVCDHNSSENIAYVQKAAKGQTITVLPGMEITSSEEVHLLALFDSLELLTDLQDVIYTHLAGVNDEDLFGCQAIVNERDEVEGFNDHLLIGATDLPLKSLIDAIHERNGLAIASHIDRESFSVISRLGFIAEDMNFDALEISARMGMEEARRRFP
jgi:predicted metal-dependent phosphoesterase TrpH